MLGTGTPAPTPDRMGASLAIVVNGTAYLVDAGVGVVRRAAAASHTVPALSPARLRFVFITHLHSDHTIGLPDLITTPWIAGRAQP
ncbi:MAG: MBL fold metallo-hydrolase, partial [Betaproteobacteria bacterium]